MSPTSGSPSFTMSLSDYHVHQAVRDREADFDRWLAQFHSDGHGGLRRVGLAIIHLPTLPPTLLDLQVTKVDPQSKWAWYATASCEGWKETRNSGDVFDTSTEAAVALKQVLDEANVVISCELPAAKLIRDIRAAADKAALHRDSFASAPTPN